MRTLLTAILLMTSFWVTSFPARGHEYHELEPIEPALRSFLIKVLEDARHEGFFQGDFENTSSVADELTELLGSLTAEDSQWLKAKAYPEFEHPTIGRLPEGVITSFFYDLAEFAHTYESHGAESFSGDDTAEADFARLSALSKSWWGTK